MYYYKEIIEKKLRERDEKINANIRFYQNKLGNNKGYKLYDVETGGEVVFETPSKAKNESANYSVINNRPFVVNKGDAKRMQTAKVDPKVLKHVKQNPSNFKNKKGKKKKIAAIISVVMAGIMAVSGFIIGLDLASKLKKKDDDNSKSTKSISTNVDKLKTTSLNSLGVKLKKPSKKAKKTSKYVKVSGNFKVENLTRGKDGILYDSPKSAKTASKIGTSKIDTKGGKLKVEKNGKVYTKEESYEIRDKNGKVIETGKGSKPKKQKESGIDYVVCPSNYYDDEGTLVHSKGEYITPNELDLCKKYYHTTKPKGDEYAKVEEEIIYYSNDSTEKATEKATEKETEKETEKVKEKSIHKVAENETEKATEKETEKVTEKETSSNQGKTNSDGTYTIYGQTYSSYADYQQYIIDGGAGYGEIDGVIQPIGNYEIEKQYTK